MDEDFLQTSVEHVNASDLELLNEFLSGHYNGSMGNYTWDDLQAMEVARIISIMHLYVVPVIILIGILGNTVSFLVYVGTPRLCRQSSSVYLAFLAAVDNVSLVFVFFVWFGWVGVHILHKNGWCQTIMYCTYVCSFLSIWTVVCFTCERWIVVFHPLKRHRLCTRKRAILVMTSLTVSAMAFYSFSIYTMQVRFANDDTPVCAQSNEHQGLLQVIQSIDTMLTVIIPSVAIIVMNTGIGIKTCRYANRKKDAQGAALAAAAAPESDVFSGMSSAQRQSENARHAGSVVSLVSHSTRFGTNATTLNPGNSKARSWRFFTRRQQTQLRITRALLIVSSVFILLNLPSYAFRVHAFIISMRNEDYRLSLSSYIWQEFIQFLYYMNFSSNFFLYCACSRNFRYALKRLWARFRRRLSKLGSLSVGFKMRGIVVRTTPAEGHVLEQQNLHNHGFK